MDRINCQGDHKDGCHTCGGFGFILEKCKCYECGREYWDRERRGTTVYEGKRFVASDGLALVWTMKGVKCASHTQDDISPRKKDE